MKRKGRNRQKGNEEIKWTGLATAGPFCAVFLEMQRTRKRRKGGRKVKEKTETRSRQKLSRYNTKLGSARCQGR